MKRLKPVLLAPRDRFDAIHAISVWLKTSSNPADSNLFRSHTRKWYKCLFYQSKLKLLFATYYGQYDLILYKKKQHSLKVHARQYQLFPVLKFWSLWQLITMLKLLLGYFVNGFLKNVTILALYWLSHHFYYYAVFFSTWSSAKKIWQTKQKKMKLILVI